MSIRFEGSARIFGDHVDTDVIIPSRFLVTDDEAELGRGAFADTYHEFYKKISKGDVLVAGRNFGCGSLREHAPIAIRGAGISCIVAQSFARTFFRNSINRGFYPVEVADAPEWISEGDIIIADIGAGEITNKTTGLKRTFTPFPDFIQEVCADSQGLLGFIQKKMDERRG